ncbi:MULTISPECIES: GAF domain-containing protein [Rhodococcus]|uniref:DUF5593 domain-containing protein n=1 Tax=Rhodococcus cerastii TaxID=908616 RepID=A0ABU4D229_9NOCA|nr:MULTISPECIES: GAF domain-containing protein [Rhodococcus]MDV6303773.1 DUF5593 domain-containing protein [Rhodococcus cerastii]MDV8057633.1 DUF5593 domain-containing protein [Rhodococcus sp. IEGM 1343]
MGRRNGDWLLILLEPDSVACVVAVGTTQKSKVPMAVFLRRSSDSIHARDAVARCAESGRDVDTECGPGRYVSARPILGDDGTVQAVWARLHPGTCDSPPSNAWAFRWNLTRGTAHSKDSPALNADVAHLSVAEAMATLDFGLRATDVLAMLVSSTVGDTVDLDATQRWTTDELHRIRVLAHTTVEGEARHLRGIAIDRGPFVMNHPSPTGVQETMSGLVAGASVIARRHTAIVDLCTLETLYWHGPPPPSIAWNLDPTDPRPRVHPDDDGAVDALAKSVSRADGAGDEPSITVRFRDRNGGYTTHSVTACALPILPDDEEPRLALVTVTEACI